MEIVVVLAGKLTQAWTVRDVGKEANSCFDEKFYALEVAQMRSAKRDEAIKMLREADLRGNRAQDQSSHRMSDHHNFVLLLSEVECLEVIVNLLFCYLGHFHQALVHHSLEGLEDQVLAPSVPLLESVGDVNQIIRTALISMRKYEDVSSLGLVFLII